MLLPAGFLWGSNSDGTSCSCHGSGWMKEKRDLKVQAIENGTVIDHIKAGQALNVLRILGISSAFRATISFVMNALGSRGKKDVVKVEGKELNVEELNRIALISP